VVRSVASPHTASESHVAGVDAVDETDELTLLETDVVPPEPPEPPVPESLHAAAAAMETKVESVRHKIIPGDRGKIGPGWLARSLWKHNRKIGFGGRIHRFH
jgi:hypothetical protein